MNNKEMITLLMKLEEVNYILNRLAAQNVHTEDHYHELAVAVWTARNLLGRIDNGQITEENTVSKADLY